MTASTAASPRATWMDCALNRRLAKARAPWFSPDSRMNLRCSGCWDSKACRTRDVSQLTVSNHGRCFKTECMNYDEFAFFNQQLAAMLREGIPLEGALKQLCQGMRAGPLRVEIDLLEADL